MRFSNITLATILVSTALAAPMAEAQAQAQAIAVAVAAPKPEAGLVSWVGGLVSGVVNGIEDVAITLTGGTPQSFNTNAFGTNLVALGQRMKLANLKCDECEGGSGHGESILQECLECIEAVCECCINVIFIAYETIEEVAEALIGAGGDFQRNNVRNLNWNALGDSYSRMAKIAPPTISKTSISDAGSQLVSWGNSAKSNKRLPASKLKTLMHGTTQLQILTQGSAPSWSIGKRYTSADFGKMLINYGNVLNLGSVPDTKLAAINGVLKQFNDAKIF
ncbi:hypothetical protein BABINDRAFT_98166 [Babjeviella inositovora NRRL Y-12698]|uniref:Uncharacterized protein n=1 Tax=Babjeviella inositovora NRRL Y-12698 TaxID=984486 RepID=A0A1E3QI98_9ASCO|nr:uncharacterized protein BABINDRAFT_98166 [Babjeviella inositovora NRRL Y-12698]ODQ77421.1 hypothetical protein BABINDRAFT_98166 [Babjeviella inositovora NRRL Y-12698]